MTRAIILLIQQSNQILDKVAPQIKEEAYKKIAKTKNQIPTEASIKQMVMDEIVSKGPELICSIESRNSINSIYDKLKSLLEKLQNITDKSNEKLLKIQEQLQKVQNIMAIIEGIFTTMRALVPLLGIASQVAKLGLKPLVGLAASGTAIVKLKDIIDLAKSKKEEIKNSLKVFKKKLKKIKNKLSQPSRIISLMIGIITKIKTSITGALGIIESYFLRYTLMCDVEGDSIEDEDYANAINNAQNDLNNTLNSINEGEEIILIQDNLLPSTIERIRNANFQVIQYRIT